MYLNQIYKYYTCIIMWLGKPTRGNVQTYELYITKNTTQFSFPGNFRVELKNFKTVSHCNII